MIFVANIINSYVLIGFMMTTSSFDTIWRVKLAFQGKWSNFTTCAYTINTKSKFGTPKRQLFGLFLHFPESPNQKEWENDRGGVKS